jgi:TrkA-C domain
VGHRIREIAWPPGCVVVAVTDGGEIAAVGDDATLRSGERVFVLAPAQPPPGRVVSSAAAAAAPIDQVEDGPPLRRHEGCPATPTKESM